MENVTRLVRVCGKTYPEAKWNEAIDRAIKEGLVVHRYADGSIAVTSGTKDGAEYTINPPGDCTCPAAQHGLLCKHLAKFRLWQAKLGALRQCVNCGGWDLKNRLEHLGPNVYAHVDCQPIQRTEEIAPPVERKTITRLEDLYQEEN